MKSEVIYGEDQRSKPSNMMSENKEELTKEVGKKGWKRDEKNQVNSSSGSQAKINSIKERVGPRYSIIQISQSFGFNLQSGNIQEATKECVNIDVSLPISLPSTSLEKSKNLKKYILCYYSCPMFFSSLFSSTLHPISDHHSPTLLHVHGSYICSLASTFTILFLISTCVFCTYHLCYLFPVPLPSFSPLPLPSDNPPCNLHFCDSVPVLVVCLVCFCFWFSC